MALTLLAPAKINLTLLITGRNAYGYHDLHSHMAFTDFGDYLTLTETDSFSFTMDGPFADTLPHQDNLVTKAATLWEQETNITVPYHVHLQKNVPPASGLGGGTSDAAALLRHLHRRFNKHLTLQRMIDHLGQEIAICMHGTAGLVTGLGETIHPFSCPTLPIIAINPLIDCPTPSVFETYRQSDQSFSPQPDTTKWNGGIHNDLTDCALHLIPSLKPRLDRLNRLSNRSGMSGSGATLFALANTVEEITIIKAEWKNHYPDDWVATGLLNPGS